MADEVRDTAPGKLRRIVLAVEQGKMGAARPTLREAGEVARRRKWIVVAADLSRFIRAASYDRRKNRDARPRDDEFAMLRTLTFGVPLATVEKPDMSEDERHAKATRRTGRAGRPRAIDYDLAAKIFASVDMIFVSHRGRVRWIPQLRELAAAFGVAPATVLRLLYRQSPGGVTWLEFFERAGAEDVPNGRVLQPARVFQKVLSSTDQTGETNDGNLATTSCIAGRVGPGKTALSQRAAKGGTAKVA